MEINNYEKSVNVAENISVDKQAVTLARTAEVVKLRDASEKMSWRDSNNGNHTIINYNYPTGTPSLAMSSILPIHNLPASYIMNRTGLSFDSVAWNFRDREFTSVEYDRRQKEKM